MFLIDFIIWMQSYALFKKGTFQIHRKSVQIHNLTAQWREKSNQKHIFNVKQDFFQLKALYLQV